MLLVRLINMSPANIKIGLKTGGISLRARQDVSEAVKLCVCGMCAIATHYRFLSKLVALIDAVMPICDRLLRLCIRIWSL